MNKKGKVEAQFIFLNEKQVEAKPAGRGRSEPDPLPEPKYERKKKLLVFFLNFWI